MPFLRKYGTGTGADIIIPMIKRGVVDFAVTGDWIPASGDVKISIDGGTWNNIGTLPVINGTYGWKFVLSNAELQGKSICIAVVDSATKAVEDQFIVIETYGHASAMYAADWSVLGATAAAQTTAQADLDLLTGADGAILATSQPNYEPAKAGDVMALTASGLASDAVAEIQSGLSTLDAAGVRMAVGLASANLDTQLSTIAGYIDTEVASIISSLATVLGHVDTEITAIKAKTDALPGDPADQSSLEAAITSAQSALEAAIEALNDLSSAQVQSAAAAAITAFGPPTRAQLTADKDEILEAVGDIDGGGGGGSSTIIVSPLESSIERRVDAMEFELYEGEHGSVVGPIRVTAAGVAVDLSSFTTLEFKIADIQRTVLQTVEHADIALSDDDDGVTSCFSFEVDAAATQYTTQDHVGRHHHWALWDVTTPDRVLIARGRCPVLRTAV